MPASPIRKLVPYAESAVKAGKHVHYLNIGQPDIKTPEIVVEKLKHLDLPVIEYSHSAGFESYRKGLVNYYKENDIDIDYTNIIITTGGSEALVFGFQTCFNPGDEVIIPEPFYANYNGFATTAGIKVVPVTAKLKTVLHFRQLKNLKRKSLLKQKALLSVILAIQRGFYIPRRSWNNSKKSY